MSDIHDERQRTGGGGWPPDGGLGTATFDPPLGERRPPDLGNFTDRVPAGTEDIGTIRPAPDMITLVSGRQVLVRKLKTRELLALVGIAAGGLGGQLGNLKLSADEPLGAFAAKFAGLLIAAAFTPEGADQVIAFLRMVCQPVGLITEGRIDKAVKARNDQLQAALDAELENPDPDDTITIVEAIARGNAGDLQSWGKRLAGIWTLAQRTGQIPASPTSRA
jgi:hypothetical protein